MQRSVIAVMVVLSSCSSNGGRDAGTRCPYNFVPCGTGCMPVNATCCLDSLGNEVGSSYCLKPAEAGCRPARPECTQPAPASSAAAFCCSSSGSEGSQDCAGANEHHCGLFCRTTSCCEGPMASACRDAGEVTPACKTNGESCSASSPCCAGAVCELGVCCQGTGSSCQSGDCCFGSCTAGTCACSPSGGFCAEASDCCEGTCKNGNCGADGEVVVTSTSCTYVGVYGISLNEFAFEMLGTVRGPIGAELVTRQGVMGSFGGGFSCAWNDGAGNAKRQAGQPELATFSWSFHFAADVRSGNFTPTVTVEDSAGHVIDTKSPTVTCN